jgi:hypothetical protein
MEWEHPREHYRIMYPTAARPVFTSGIIEHDVVDISEQGMRFRAAEGEMWEVEHPVAGVVRFQRREEVKVNGVVIRVVGQEIAARLSVGIPLKTILDEQRYLREHHRGLAW